MQKRKFITGALWLTVTGAALRAVGMLYRVFISGKLGEAGMGLYQLILSVYMLCSAFATAGVSIAVTRLVSHEQVSGGKRSIRAVMNFSLSWSITVALLIAVVLFTGANFIAATFLHSPASAPGLRILSLGLPFMAASAVFNGYFMARSRVWLSCAAQVAEQAVRITLVAFCIDRFAAISVEAGCNAVFMGNAASEFVAAALLYCFYLSDLRSLPEGGEKKAVFSCFLPIQFPIAVGKYISSLLHTVENILVPGRLEKFGGDRSQALADFGALKGMALPLIMFPSSFLSSLAGLLIPELTAAATLRQQEKIKVLTGRTLQLTFWFSILMGGMFFRFAPQLGMLIYKSRDVGRILQFLAPVIPFMYLDCITDGLLKGIGEQFASLRYSTTDSLMRIALVFLLLHRYGLTGFLVVMVISNASVALLGLRRLLKVTEAKLPVLQGLLLPLTGVVLAHLLTMGLSSLLPAGILYLLIYLLFLLVTGALSLKEFAMFFKPQQ